MMIFMSLYTIVDGIFVCRFVGSSALSAVNIVYPLVSVVIGLGVMLATGGTIASKESGRGLRRRPAVISPSWSSPGRRWGRSSPCWDWRSPPPCPGCWAPATPC